MTIDPRAQIVLERVVRSVIESIRRRHIHNVIVNKAVAQPEDLKPPMSLKTQITNIRTYPVADSI